MASGLSQTAKPITAMKDHRNISTAQNFYPSKQSSTSVFFGGAGKQQKASNNLVMRRGAAGAGGGQSGATASRGAEQQSENMSAQRIIEAVNVRAQTNKVLLNPISSKRNSGLTHKLGNTGALNSMKPPQTNDQIVVIEDE